MSEKEIRLILLCENIGELAYCGLLDKLDESNNNDLNELKKQAIKGLLDLYDKEKEKNKELEIQILSKSGIYEIGIDFKNDYISKDKILDILGYEEDDEQRKNMTTEKILSLIETIFEECDRLEDIEDRKVQVEIQNIENRRDKEWEDKIREKINKYLEYDKKVKTYTYDGRENFTLEWYKAKALQELLEEEF